MANISKIGLDKGEYRYEAALEWDDEALMNGSISFNVIASRELLNNPDSREEISVSASIEQDNQKRAVLVLRHNNEPLGEPVPLDDLFDETPIIDSIPGLVFGGGDPIAGCLIKAGVSTSVAQILSCKSLTSRINRYIERTKAIGRCLIQSIPGMCAKAAYRSIVCISTGGTT